MITWSQLLANSAHCSVFSLHPPHPKQLFEVTAIQNRTFKTAADLRLRCILYNIVSQLQQYTGKHMDRNYQLMPHLNAFVSRVTPAPMPRYMLKICHLPNQFLLKNGIRLLLSYEFLVWLEPWLTLLSTAPPWLSSVLLRLVRIRKLAGHMQKKTTTNECKVQTEGSMI